MNNQKMTTLLLAIMMVLLVGGGTLIIKIFSRHGGMDSMSMSSASSTEALPVSIQTVADQQSELGGLENTWPGEIISFGDIQIQPSRAGTIVEWNVNIGQKVRRGQIIAKLSAPPAMPELTSMLAEQAKMLTEARVDAKAQIEFAEKKKQQLLNLREAIDKSKNISVDLLAGSPVPGTLISAQEAISQAKKVADFNQKEIHSSLEQSIRKELQMLTHNEIDIVSLYKSGGALPRIYVMESFGKINDAFRYAYLTVLFSALKELIKENGDLETVGIAYFQAATKMVGATYSDDEITTSQLVEIRKMIAMDQMAFLDTLKDYQMSKSDLVKMEIEYRLMLAEKETDYAMQRKEVEEQIAMLEKDISMNNGRVEAVEASYNTIAGSINGGLAIVSPANGTISSVMKKNGDFVEPGMAIASLNTGRKEDRFVRFKIPSNIRLPEPETKLTITRLGFPKEIKQVKLIGIGTALDNNGSYLADARFIDSVDWPVNVSVRVFPDDKVTSSLFVNLGALEWGEKGASLWVVGANDTIKKQVVKTGRTLGEKVEVYEGLLLGDRYVAKLVPDLKEGIKVREGEVFGMAKISEEAHGHDN